MKKEKGITLISLVITILIIIILVSVSVRMIIGDNGILANTKQVADEYEKKEIAEELGSILLAAKVEEFDNKTDETTLAEYIKQHFDKADKAEQKQYEIKNLGRGMQATKEKTVVLTEKYGFVIDTKEKEILASGRRKVVADIFNIRKEFSDKQEEFSWNVMTR